MGLLSRMRKSLHGIPPRLLSNSRIDRAKFRFRHDSLK
jgi:hypothetical protein